MKAKIRPTGNCTTADMTNSPSVLLPNNILPSPPSHCASSSQGIILPAFKKKYYFNSQFFFLICVVPILRNIKTAYVEKCR